MAETLRIKGLTETSGKPKSAASPEHDSHAREPTGTDVAPIPPLIPAAAIAILTVGVNFVVDWFLHHTSGLKE